MERENLVTKSRLDTSKSGEQNRQKLRGKRIAIKRKGSRRKKAKGYWDIHTIMSELEKLSNDFEVLNLSNLSIAKRMMGIR